MGLGRAQHAGGPQHLVQAGRQRTQRDVDEMPPLENVPPEIVPVDPNRALFAKELIGVQDRLHYLRDMESTDEAVRTAQQDLGKAISEMETAQDERRYEDARKLLKTAIDRADTVERAHDSATQAQSDFYKDYQKIVGRRQVALGSLPPTEWTKKAKLAFVAADNTLQTHIGNDAWEDAGKALTIVVGRLDDFDRAAKQELESKLAVLDGWDEAKSEAGTLRGDLNKLSEPLLGDSGYASVANAISAALTGWRDVRVHKTEMDKLAAEFGCIAHIPDKDTAAALTVQWDAYTTAKGKAPAPNTITDTAGHDKLAELRDEYAKAGRALVKAYELGVAGDPPDDPYYKSIRDQLVNQKVIPLRLANKVPDTTPEIVRLKAEMNAADSKSFATYKEYAETRREVIEKAERLIAMRTAPQDPELVKLFARFREAETSLRAANDTVPSSGATEEQQEYRRRYLAFLAKLNGADEDRVAVCDLELGWLIPEAEKALDTATQALKNTTGTVKALPESNGPEKRAKSRAARNAIKDASPEMLARLSTDEKLDLLESLRTNGMPRYDKNEASKTNKKQRAMMRKLYHAMTLEEQFAKKDEENRQKLIEALKDKKQELKDAKENWLIMTDEQKLELLKMVATEHCKVFKFTLPSNGIVVANEPDSTDNGSYSPSSLNVQSPVDGPDSDRIKINSAKPVFHDFEAALDLIIHENSHRNQNILCRALRYPSGDAPQYLTKDNSDPPYTQTRMFNMGNVPGGYVTGSEDYATYKKQPEEEHAWLAGPRGAQGIIDMLDRISADVTDARTQQAAGKQGEAGCPKR